MRTATAVCGLALLAGLLSAPGTAHAVADPAPRTQAAVTAKRTSGLELLRALPARRQTPRGYARQKFPHWVDADRDCRDTRAEVLAAESGTTTRGTCTITGGTWRSAYDGRVFTNPSQLDVDHLVPLAEAWRSGAKSWTRGTRKRFANDLGYSQSLIAVSASTNRSKGDREPHRWMPPDVAYHCAYVASWVAVKWRWRLSANKAERRFLRRTLTSCGDPVFSRPSRAAIKVAPSSPKAKHRPRPPGGGLDPRFDYCYEAVDAGYGPYYRGKDPEYHWYRDADGDGVVCE